MAYVQSTRNNTIVGNTIAATLVGVAPGATLTVHVSRDSGVTFSSIADTAGTSYGAPQQSQTDTNNGEQEDVWSAHAGGSGTVTVTVTYLSAPGDAVIDFIEHSGRDATTPVRASAKNAQFPPGGADPGTGAGAITCGPVTATAGDDVVLLIANSTGGGSANTYSAGAGMTAVAQFGTGASALLALLRADNVSAGAFTATATQTINQPAGSFVLLLAQSSGASVVPDDADATIPAFLLKPPAAVLDVLIAA